MGCLGLAIDTVKTLLLQCNNGVTSLRRAGGYTHARSGVARVMPKREPRLIKKYGNRRLYDTSESRYITMDELAESVRRGTDVRVLDAQTNDDLTQSTLTQIIIEGR